MSDTVRVKSDNPAHEQGFYLIDAAAFDEAKHVLFEEEPAKVKIKTDKNQRGWTEIPLDDFDAEKHELHEEPTA